MILGTIDLGTNTVLMVVGSKEPSGTVRILADEHDVGRLGKGVDANGLILPETFDRIARILTRYRLIAEELGAEKIIGFGTSALRDARNRDQFIAAMMEQAGVELQLLSGTDEAELSFQGALFGLQGDTDQIAVIDIGGGSTEIAQGVGKSFLQGVSINVGAVRVTERFFGGELPPSKSAVADAREFIRTAFLETLRLPTQTTVVGVAGTITTLGAMSMGLDRFDPREVNGARLSGQWIRKTTEALLKLGLEEIKEILQVMEGREDIITGGGLVLDEFVRAFDVKEIIVSTQGLRYGLLMQQLERYNKTL